MNKPFTWNMVSSEYRGRIAPTPTGLLHLGHASTFKTAHERCRAARGCMIFRIENLDPQRCKPEFIEPIRDDLHWLGIDWDEGPDCGGPFAPYTQSERLPRYREAWKRLKDGGWIYPCRKSRKDLQETVTAPHGEDEDREPLYPTEWRPPRGTEKNYCDPGSVNWRFRVPDGRCLSFNDGHYGPQQYTAGVDFGDFLIWRRDGVPSYELAVVVDDIAMRITEVVRGADLLKSTARQILLYEALGAAAPAFYHCPLVRDEKGRRLAKRHPGLTLKTLREQGADPATLTFR